MVAKVSSIPNEANLKALRNIQAYIFLGLTICHRTKLLLLRMMNVMNLPFPAPYILGHCASS